MFNKLKKINLLFLALIFFCNNIFSQPKSITKLTSEYQSSISELIKTDTNLTELNKQKILLNQQFQKLKKQYENRKVKDFVKFNKELDLFIEKNDTNKKALKKNNEQKQKCEKTIETLKPLNLEQLGLNLTAIEIIDEIYDQQGPIDYHELKDLKDFNLFYKKILDERKEPLTLFGKAIFTNLCAQKKISDAIITPDTKIDEELKAKLEKLLEEFSSCEKSFLNNYNILCKIFGNTENINQTVLENAVKDNMGFFSKLLRFSPTFLYFANPIISKIFHFIPNMQATHPLRYSLLVAITGLYVQHKVKAKTNPLAKCFIDLLENIKEIYFVSEKIFNLIKDIPELKDITLNLNNFINPENLELKQEILRYSSKDYLQNRELLTQNIFNIMNNKDFENSLFQALINIGKIDTYII